MPDETSELKETLSLDNYGLEGNIDDIISKLTNSEKEIEPIRLSEYANNEDISKPAALKRIKTGKVKAEKNNDGDWLVWPKLSGTPFLGSDEKKGEKEQELPETENQVNGSVSPEESGYRHHDDNDPIIIENPDNAFNKGRYGDNQSGNQSSGYREVTDDDLEKERSRTSELLLSAQDGFLEQIRQHIKDKDNLHESYQQKIEITRSEERKRGLRTGIFISVFVTALVATASFFFLKEKDEALKSIQNLAKTSEGYLTAKIEKLGENIELVKKQSEEEKLNLIRTEREIFEKQREKDQDKFRQDLNARNEDFTKLKVTQAKLEAQLENLQKEKEQLKSDLSILKTTPSDVGDLNIMNEQQKKLQHPPQTPDE